MALSNVVESVSWHDLEQMKPMDTLIFKDPDSIELIIEFAEENKDWISATCTKVGIYDYCVYFKEVKGKDREWHKPRALSPEFLEEKLFMMRGSDIVTASQLREKVNESFASSMPEKLSPIYEHTLGYQNEKQ